MKYQIRLNLFYIQFEDGVKSQGLWMLRIC